MLAQLSHAWWSFILLGLAAGVLSSSLGLGGGTVIVPVLVLFLHFAQKPAQGMALAVMVPMTLVGAFRYWSLGIEMDRWVVFLMVCGSLVGAIIGSGLASRLPAPVLRKVFAIFLMVIAFKMLTGSPKGDNSKPPDGATSLQNVSTAGDGEVGNGTGKQ